MENRQTVIEELLKLAKTSKGSAEFLTLPKRFLEWQEVTDILGTIKALEAIDVLIECLDCNDGRAGLSPARYPATRAIVKIGAEAIPKLSEVLDGQSPGKRFMAVQALYAIGGDRAKKALERSLHAEKDSRIAARINEVLSNWSNSGKALER